MLRSRLTSACTSSFWFVTEMYSPVPIENAPATRAATPVRTTAWADTPPPPTPAISEAFVTSPSTAPNTVGRRVPPETSRCRCDQPAPAAAAPVAKDGSRASSSSVTCWIIPHHGPSAGMWPSRPGPFGHLMCHVRGGALSTGRRSALAGLHADQAPRLVVDPGEHDRGPVRAGQLEPAVDLVHVTRQAPPAKVGRPDPEGAQPAGEVLLVPRGGLDHAQGPREGRALGGPGGQERDTRIDLPGAEPPGQRFDQAGPGHGRIRIKEKLSRRGDGDPVRSVLPGLLSGPLPRFWPGPFPGPFPSLFPGLGHERVPLRQDRRASGGRGEGGRPQHRLLEIPAVRHELRLPAGRDNPGGQARRGLDGHRGHLAG